MQAFRRGMSRQQETLWVVGLALLCVLAYTLWGATLLRAEKEAGLTGQSVATTLSAD